ncbi:acetolactate synthase small subunit [Alicyclobacillus cycloheptanicus]|uniref:Acetolactate synthase small subunit n=1 Tax=Alicyclobacillus cycloheptanicus TaxID=1457 RepID=A0ABT9XF74_9BACL|nr:acetolactate synthase small subunit [Alicyclobacillus cycloheptanicus]MDQ0188954.1 acetolactate synthase-1/3 small subunit [Alicyclobacillus cycloheptanicus]WDM01697.1 acetolactate synthase small subunit [Alicyclobacillus cycloheptanicus]
MNHVLTVLVNNQMGVLNRITALFLKRGFNIQSLTVGPTETEGLSRMTIVIHAEDDRIVEQVIKQLHKQVDVLKVFDITSQPMVARELVVIKVNSSVQNRGEVTTLIEPFRASIIDVGRESVTVQATGRSDKIDALIALLRPYGIRELARTGIAAFTRDSETSSEVIRLKQLNLLPI